MFDFKPMGALVVITYNGDYFAAADSLLEAYRFVCEYKKKRAEQEEHTWEFVDTSV